VDNELMTEVIELLRSGDDTGCDGLVVVGREELLAVRKLVQKHTGRLYGNVSDDEDGDDDDDGDS
jgi:hypothetical protein